MSRKIGAGMLLTKSPMGMGVTPSCAVADSVEEDARHDETHGREREQVREMLVGAMGDVLASDRQQAQDDVTDEGDGHERQADAAHDGQPPDLPHRAPERF